MPEINIVRKTEEIISGQLNLRVCNTDRIEITPGEPSVQAGKFAFDALQLAVSDIKEGYIENILTAPLDKNTTAEAGLEFNGHTQYLANEFDSNVQMILLNDDLRVAMVTGHTSLKNVPEKISKRICIRLHCKVHGKSKSRFWYI